MAEQQQVNYDGLIKNAGASARSGVNLSVAGYFFGSTTEYAGLLSGAYGALGFYSEGMNGQSAFWAGAGLIFYTVGKLIQHAVNEINATNRSIDEIVMSELEHEVIATVGKESPRSKDEKLTN
mgnify:CR=1 FL=1